MLPLAPRPLPPRAAPGNGQAGFTLVELLIVTVIVSTIAVAAAPLFTDTLESMKATALAREIATDVRYAQELAVRTGVPHRVSFWPPGYAYAVLRWDNGGWELCEHPVTKKPWQAALDEHSRYAGLTIEEARFGGSTDVTFDTFGAPDNGGYVRFTLGKSTRTVTVAPLSGKITVE